ncbi:MAG: TetR/AcrR family transcriptional regulator [Deltaproteobacteria bacterium]|nr:TetR/AcrR family transcriptional regulator [Deltaproteobacteria bacterium]
MTKKDKLYQIYEVALRVFAKYGYKKATVEDIAKEMGMTKGNLYLYTKSKKDLYEKTVAHGLLRWQARVRKEMEGQDDIVKRFVIMCTKAFEYLSKDSALRAVLINDPTIFPLSPHEDRFTEINRASMDMLKGILQTGIEQGRFCKIDVDHITQFLFSIYVMFIIKAYVKPEGRSTQAMFDEGLGLILRGLLKNERQAGQPAILIKKRR